MRQFTPEELLKKKEELSELCISINDVEEEKKAAMEDFNKELKPLLERKKVTLGELKKKAELVSEDCYKFIDPEAREVGFYNQNGDLVESRPAYSEELQQTIFQVMRTGTGQ